MAVEAVLLEMLQTTSMHVLWRRCGSSTQFFWDTIVLAPYISLLLIIGEPTTCYTKAHFNTAQFII